MKILVRPRLCGEPLARRLAADPALARALGAEPNTAVGFVFKKFFDSEGPVLDAVLAHAAAVGERVDFLRDLSFAPAELEGATHLEVVCRKTVAQSPAEVRATLQAYESTPATPSAGGWQVRLPAEVFLGKPVPDDAIAHVDQYTGEYVLGAGAAAALRASGLSGAQLAPVRHWKTHAPLPGGAAHLRCSTLLPPVCESPTWWRGGDGGFGTGCTPRRHGLLAWPAGALAQAPDFARTAEPWAEWGTPQWIVSQRVRAWCAQAGVRGWAFWPTLQQGSPLHHEHEARFGSLLARLRGAGASLAA